MANPLPQLPHLAEGINKLRELAQMKGYEGDRAQQRSIDIDGVLQAAAAMIEKLGIAQEKGRSGWHDPKRCDASTLLAHLLEHLPKGDPVDWLNFSMMIWFRKDDFGYDEVGEKLWQDQLNTMIDAFCRDQLQKEYAVMEEIYTLSTAKVRAEAEAAQRGSLLLDKKMTLENLGTAQRAINGYLQNVFTELLNHVPQGLALDVSQRLDENGIPVISLGVGPSLD